MSALLGHVKAYRKLAEAYFECAAELEKQAENVSQAVRNGLIDRQLDAMMHGTVFANAANRLEIMMIEEASGESRQGRV